MLWNSSREYRALLDKEKATALDVPALVSAYRDLAVGYVEAKQVQVDALNEAGFSLAEYRWVRSQAYAALGMPMMDMDVGKIVEDIRAGRTPGATAAIDSDRADRSSSKSGTGQASSKDARGQCWARVLWSVGLG